MFVHPDILPLVSVNYVRDEILKVQPPRFKPGDVVRKHGKLVVMTVQSVFPPESGRWRYWVHYVWDGQTYAKVMDEHELEAK